MVRAPQASGSGGKVKASGAGSAWQASLCSQVDLLASCPSPLLQAALPMPAPLPPRPSGPSSWLPRASRPHLPPQAATWQLDATQQPLGVVPTPL